MQDGKTNLLLALAFLLGVACAGLLFGQAGADGPRLALDLAAAAGLVGLGLGIGALYVGLTAARLRSPDRPAVPHRQNVASPTIGEALPTVTDYYRNAADGEPLRRSTYPGRRLPDPHWLREPAAAGEDDAERAPDA